MWHAIMYIIVKLVVIVVVIGLSLTTNVVVEHVELVEHLLMIVVIGLVL
jgi:hypothetical protein